MDEPADDGVVSARAVGSTRAAWFDVSCCPTYVARTLAALDTYLPITDDDGVQLHRYATSTLGTTVPDGREVALDVETDYRRSGVVRGTVAVERGPEVMCLESTDLDLRDDIDGGRVDLTQPPRERHGRVEVTGIVVDGDDREWAYRPAVDTHRPARRSVTLPMRPCHQWSQRGPTAMRIWLPLRTGRD